MGHFTAADKRLLADTDEVGVEFKPGRKIPIWIVVDADQVYVRSVRGPEGRWYQALAGGQPVQLYAGDTAWSIKAEHVTDAAEIQRVSDALSEKYQQRWPGPTAAMLREPVLPTTLRVEAVP
jgi:hypothetical protein